MYNIQQSRIVTLVQVLWKAFAEDITSTSVNNDARIPRPCTRGRLACAILIESHFSLPSPFSFSQSVIRLGWAQAGVEEKRPYTAQRERRVCPQGMVLLERVIKGRDGVRRASQRSLLIRQVD